MSRVPLISVALTSMVVLTGPAISQTLGPEAGWRLYQDEFGTRVEYPSELFSRESRPPAVGMGQSFTTPDRRAELSIYSFPNDQGVSPERYVRNNLTDPRSMLTYDRTTKRFFAVSMNKGDRILYKRCNFSGRTIHCINLEYPRQEKRAWDATVTRISRSLRPL